MSYIQQSRLKIITKLRLAHTIHSDFFFFSETKIEKFYWKTFTIFSNFAQIIDCGNTLEPPRRGGSNQYSQSMFWSKNKKWYIPCIPQFCYIKVGYMGYTLPGHVFMMETRKICR